MTNPYKPYELVRDKIEDTEEALVDAIAKEHNNRIHLAGALIDLESAKKKISFYIPVDA